jgi:hypothetical protein
MCCPEIGMSLGSVQAFVCTSNERTAVPAAVVPPPVLQYGRLRPQGVILKTQKGRESYAFVDFEEPAPAQVCGDARSRACVRSCAVVCGCVLK